MINKDKDGILIITPTFSPDVGGVETMLTNFCDFLAKREFKVNVITYVPLIVKTKAPLVEKLNDFITVRRIPWPGFGLFNTFEHYTLIQFFYLVPALTVTTILFLFFSKNQVKLIHAFGLSGAFSGGLASRIFNIPCIVDMCTVYRLPERRILAWFVRLILNWSDYVRGNNPTGKQELVNIGISSDKVGMISPPVDETVFKPMPQVEARAKTGLPQHGFIALFVGRMVSSKGVEIAVNATFLIKRNDVTFVFIGEGPLRQMAEKASTKDKRIFIIGNVRHYDLAYYYNAADILMCAPVDSELIAFVGREALMCGLPILAPNIGTYFNIPYSVHSSLLPPGVGRLLEPAPEALAASLQELISLKAANEASPFDRQACRKHALEHYSSRSMEWLEDAYQKAGYF